MERDKEKYKQKSKKEKKSRDIEPTSDDYNEIIEIRKEIRTEIFRFDDLCSIRKRRRARALKLSMPVKVVAWMIFLGPATAPAARGEFSLLFDLYKKGVIREKDEKIYSLSLSLSPLATKW